MLVRKNVKENTKRMTDGQVIELLTQVLQDLFEAEEIELFEYGNDEFMMFPELRIKMHGPIGFDEMTLLRHLAEKFSVEVDEETEEIVEDKDLGRYAQGRLVVEIMPLEHWVEKLVKKQKKEKREENDSGIPADLGSDDDDPVC